MISSSSRGSAVTSSGVDLVCPTHRTPLSSADDTSQLRCDAGCVFPVKDGIPRFVPRDNYARGFGLQWTVFRTTQLDSRTGTTISEDRLRRIAGGDLSVFRGKRVLEAGCGAGRFSEVMLRHGARLFAVDLSTAVEANFANCSGFPDYFVCQADVRHLPAAPETFDIVVCIGVIQHTPDSEATIAALCRYVRPGGMLLIDHYGPDYVTTAPRRIMRKILLSQSPRVALKLCHVLVATLWPLHRITFPLRNRRFVWRLYRWLTTISPVVDYQEAYPQLDKHLLYQWAVLDTHDTTTDRFKHLRSVEQIASHLRACGMEDVVAVPGGNGVEARATKRSETAQRVPA